MYAAYGIASCQSSGASLVVRIFTTLYNITLTIRDVLSEFDKPPMGAACTATSSVSRLAFAARVVLLFKESSTSLKTLELTLCFFSCKYCLHLNWPGEICKSFMGF